MSKYDLVMLADKLITNNIGEKQKNLYKKKKNHKNNWDLEMELNNIAPKQKILYFMKSS